MQNIFIFFSNVEIIKMQLLMQLRKVNMLKENVDKSRVNSWHGVHDFKSCEQDLLVRSMIEGRIGWRHRCFVLCII